MAKNIDEGAAKLAGLIADLCQKIRNGSISIEHLFAFLNATREEKDFLLCPIIKIRAFEVKIPENYQYKPLEIKGLSFPRPSHVLEKGDYRAEIYLVVNGVGYKRMINWAKSRGGLFAGIPGLLMAWQEIQKTIGSSDIVYAIDNLERLYYSEKIVWQEIDQGFNNCTEERGALLPYIEKGDIGARTAFGGLDSGSYIVLFFKK